MSLRTAIVYTMAWLAAPEKGPKKYFSSGADFAQEPGYLLIDTVKLHEDNAPLCPNRNPCYLPRLLPRNLHPAHVPRRRGGPGLPMGDTRPLADGNAWPRAARTLRVEQLVARRE